MMSLEEIQSAFAMREKEERKFWDAPLTKATIAAELPFWLMVEPSEVELLVGDCPATATIHQGLVGYHEGGLCLNSNNNLIAVAYDGRLPRSEQARIDSVESVVKRLMKTTIEFDIEIHESVISAWGQRNSVLPADNSKVSLVNLAMQYMSSLAYAHLPFVNRLIYAYRSTSFDPFAFEVSEWDIANWYIETEESFCIVNLMPYKSLDSSPDVGVFGKSTRSRYLATTPGDVQAQALTELTPGKSQILDAKSLLVRGRFSEAIRSAVTAIEVSVEAKTRELLLSRGLQNEQLEAELAETKMDFFERLRRLQMLIGRRIPGPRVFWDWLNDDSDDPPLAPYLNGVQLTRELDAVRRIRHEIVHRGLGVSIFDRGPALRAIETMSWLFEWLEPNDPFGEDTENYAFYSTMRGQFPLEASFTKDGVCMREPKLDWENDVVFPKDSLIEQYRQSLEGDVPDVDVFAAMTLSALGVSYSDADPSSEQSRLAHEQLWAKIGKRDTLVFSLERGTRLDVNAVSRLIQRKRNAEISSGRRLQGLVFLENANSLIERDDFDEFFRENLLSLQLADITLVDANRVMGCILAMDKYGWDQQWIIKKLSQPGFSDCIPDVFSAIGSVKRPLPRHSAVSISLNEDSHFKSGDCLMFLVSNRFIEFTPPTIQVERTSVEQVDGPIDFGAEVPDGIPPIKSNWLAYTRRADVLPSDSSVAVPD
ncbi:hypothetical protein Pan14r_39530 [Crateriforma conspicua]|uniref:Uncharacterized protein n=1 Tax=Crateriforma conspicua TaxID=2527996 RepID=A0A5C5Y9Z8_9PLAN|nr:hypothetical protein Pan14r_39530 [Crateriforma conspicua]